MKIGFEAKRAFKNFTGLGNYARSTIQILTKNTLNINTIYTLQIGLITLELAFCLNWKMW